MKTIITLLVSLTGLASLAQALNHDGIRRLIAEDITPNSIWHSADTNACSNIDIGLPETNQSARTIVDKPTPTVDVLRRIEMQERTERDALGLPPRTEPDLYLHANGSRSGPDSSLSRGSTNLAEWPQISMTWNRFTNVVTGDNHTGCSICDGISKNHWLLYHPQHDGGLPYVPPTERWTITTVGVRHTATIPGWPGELVKEEITSCTTNREFLKADWVKVEPIKIQIISGGGGGFENGTITNVISKSITNTFYYFPNTSGALFVYPHTNDLGEMRGITWQYDGNRNWNKDIEELKRSTEAESKRVMEKTGESTMYIRGDDRILFDFKTDARDIELGYKPDGTVTWRKTPERNKP